MPHEVQGQEKEPPAPLGTSGIEAPLLPQSIRVATHTASVMWGGSWTIVPAAGFSD